jgi:L-rhamnose mutarotase
MQRVAFKMKMLPGMKAEYKKRHDEVWPEIVELIKRSGISDNSPVTIPLEEVFYLA